MSLDLAALRAAVARHGRVARVVLAEARGSAPREAGAFMLVWPGGQQGTIGGGALEWDAAQTARRLLAEERGAVARLPLGPALGQCCGGAVTLVTDLWDSAALDAVQPPAHLRRVEGAGEPPLALLRALRMARNSGQPVRTRLQSGWLIEPIAAPSRALWIYGAGHVGRALVAVLAPLPDLAITWIDTAADRFPNDVPPGVTPRIAPNPADAVALAPAKAEHLILTYSHAHDLEICHRLLGHGFGAAGLIGSHTKWARFRGRLRQLGHSDAQISRIRCPIGQKALGKHPQAIAVGVAADLLSRSIAVLGQEAKG